jgi:hypothetical protein
MAAGFFQQFAHRPLAEALAKHVEQAQKERPIGA